MEEYTERSPPLDHQEYVVDVKLEQWRHLPVAHKALMIKEKILNARTTHELQAALKMKRLVASVREST